MTITKYNDKNYLRNDKNSFGSDQYKK